MKGLIARIRILWLTDHPGRTAADFERVRQQVWHRQIDHDTYLQWLSSSRVQNLLFHSSKRRVVHLTKKPNKPSDKP